MTEARHSMSTPDPASAAQGSVWLRAACRFGNEFRSLQAIGGIWWVLLTAICAGVVMRLAVRVHQGFWEDEIIAVTNAVQPLPQFFIEVVRDSMHPPPYFLQLHFWSWVSTTDRWFVFNSVLWGLIALISLWIVQRRVRGSSVAWASVAILAVLPSGLWMSQEVRPYAWLSVLLIWGYAFTERNFAASDPRSRDQWVLFLLCLLIVYTHAIGFYAVLFIGLYALALMLRRRASPNEAWRFVRIFGLSALASLPVLTYGLIVDANLHHPEGLAHYLTWAGGVVTIGRPPRLAGACVYLAVVAAGLAVARARLLTLCFLIAPVLGAISLEIALKPIFKDDFFATLMAPFMAIVLAEVAVALRPRLAKQVVPCALAGLFVMAVIGWANKSRSTDFRPAASDIMAAMRAGDVVYVPQRSMFWGLAWYLDGPNWGSALEVGGQPSEKMERIFSWLGPTLVDGLGLRPKTHLISLPDGLVMVTGNQGDPAVDHASRVWLVTYDRADLPPGMPPPRLGTLSKTKELRYSQLVVSLYQ
jgi:hypothetical protein